MARPLPLTSGTFNYPLQPASRELCDALGVLMVTASPERMVTLNRLYDRMTPAAKARVTFARSWLMVQS